MLTLRALVQDAVVPLLGPPTSIGDVHHGAWYYYLLSPAAAITGGDSPLAVVALIALAGIAAVGVVWWLARQIGGPLAGAVAGLAAAVSAAAIDEFDVHLEPEPHRALERACPGRCLAGVERRRSALVAAGRRRNRRHDAVPHPGHRAAADRRGALRPRREAPRARAGAPRRARDLRGGLSAAARQRADHEGLGAARGTRLPGGGRGRERDRHPGSVRDRGTSGAELAADRADHGRLHRCRACERRSHRHRRLAGPLERARTVWRHAGWAPASCGRRRSSRSPRRAWPRSFPGFRTTITTPSPIRWSSR